VLLVLSGNTLAHQLADGTSDSQSSTPGDYHQWAEKWIEDSAGQAIEVYRGFTFGPATMKPDGAIDRIELTLPDQFWPRQLTLAKVQMTKAAVHLGQLLNAIHFR
jgi:hypothetical protein